MVMVLQGRPLGLHGVGVVSATPAAPWFKGRGEMARGGGGKVGEKRGGCVKS